MTTEETVRQFMGSVVACFTHEIQNNLATIHVVAGLLGDMADRGNSIEPAQLTRLSAMTNKHVSCALNLIRYLNRYAHRFDEEVSSFCVNDALEELLALTGRICREKQVDVRTLSCSGRATIRSSPVLLQSLLFSLLQTILEATPTEAEGMSVSVRIRPARGAATIEITTDRDLWPSSRASQFNDDANMGALLSALGITVTFSPDRQTFTLHIPSRDSSEGEAQ